MPSYYKIINGKKYDRSLLDFAEELTEGGGDGRISEGDAMELARRVKDGWQVTLIERQTLNYILDHYRWTDSALEWWRLNGPKDKEPNWERRIESIIHEEYRLTGMKWHIDPAEIIRQQKLPNNEVKFGYALREALRCFLLDERDMESPRNLVREVFRLFPDRVEDAEERLDAFVRKFMNAGIIYLISYFEGELSEEEAQRESLATVATTEEPAEAFAEALTYLPDPDAFELGPRRYLDRLRAVREAVDVPVVASLNGYTEGGWLRFAALAEEAGASAIELNLYYVATDPEESAAAVEDRDVAIVRAVKESVSCPVAVKLSPYFTALPHFARRLRAAGADGLVLFNRGLEPDIDTDALEMHLPFGLSSPADLPLRLRWLSLLADQLPGCSLAVTGGVHDPLDAVKAIMAGADSVQQVSALLRNGPAHLAVMRRGLAEWLEENEYDSLAQMRGSMSRDRCPDPDVLSRANYMRLLQTWRPR